MDELLAGQRQPDVAVVTTTLNRAQRLQRLLDALERQTLRRDRCEVVVIDNGSTDETARVLREATAAAPGWLRVITHGRNGSPALARERGWRATDAPLIAFTDDDCVPDPGWLETGLEAAALHPGAILQGRTEPDPAEADQEGPFSRTMRVRERDPGFQTCNIFYPRRLLEAVDGFDHEAFPRLGGEDTDLAWRAIASGAGAVFVSDALVHHAVHDLGLIGRLRHALRWAPAMLAYKRHAGLRRQGLVWGFFWKRSHRSLFFALLGLTLRSVPAPVRGGLAAPYVLSLYRRSRARGGPPWIPCYLALLDLFEAVAVVRGAARFRRPLF